MVYNIDVANVNLPSTQQTIDYWPQGQTYSANWSYTYSNTVYLYQLICPKCKTTNWGEVDKTITCSGTVGRKDCSAKIKAIREKVDFEIPVG